MKTCPNQGNGFAMIKCHCGPNNCVYKDGKPPVSGSFNADDLMARMQAAPDKLFAYAMPPRKAPKAVRGNQLPDDDASRGQFPMADGLLDYFPNALAEVSKVSFKGSQKHNAGQPMHWARGKSTDHRNKLIRHTVDSRDDTEAAIEHAANAAWRSLALLQEKIEKVRGIQISGASK